MKKAISVLLGTIGALLLSTPAKSQVIYTWAIQPIGGSNCAVTSTSPTQPSISGYTSALFVYQFMAWLSCHFLTGGKF